MNNRRDFLKKTLAGGAALCTAPVWAEATKSAATTEAHALSKGEVILFQGDSITDAGRRRESMGPNDSSSFGGGYMYLAATRLLCDYPEMGLQIYNRGISGNKVHQLAERWQEDCLDLNPSVLSILIGVNDFWHTITHNYQGTIETYTNDLRALLRRTQKARPGIRLIIGEPFGLKGVKFVDDSWYPAFDQYRAAAARIAKEFNATFIPYQSIFDAACKKAPASYWTSDGVHVTMAGAQLMADAWVKALKSK